MFPFCENVMLPSNSYLGVAQGTWHGPRREVAYNLLAVHRLYLQLIYQKFISTSFLFFSLIASNDN
jgi:hypothetical protein